MIALALVHLSAGSSRPVPLKRGRYWTNLMDHGARGRN